MDKLLQQMKEEWERMTPEQKKKWEADKEERLKEFRKDIEEFQKTPLTEEQKRYFAWMDSVEDGSYRTPEQKEKLHQRAMKIYQKIREREIQQNNS